MAKGNALLGTLKGKIGDVVFSRSNGEQISRVKVTPSNPKTLAQMSQRMIFATVTKAYSIMQALCNHSLQGVAYGRKTQQKWVQKNLDILRQIAAENGGNFSAPGLQFLIPARYLMSEGTLVPPAMIKSNQGIVMAASNGNVIESVVTVGEFLAGNSAVQKGDQITLVVVSESGAPSVTVGGVSFAPTEFKYCRITIPADAADTDEFFNVNTLKFGATIVTEGIDQFDFSYNNMEGDERIEVESGVACAVILSRKAADGSYLRSTSYLQETQAGNFSAYEFERVLPTWLASSSSLVDDNRYLNNTDNDSEISVSHYLADGNITALNAQNAPVGMNNAAVIVSTTSTGNGSTSETKIIVNNLLERKVYTTNGTRNQVVLSANHTASGTVITLEEAQRLISDLTVAN